MGASGPGRRPRRIAGLLLLVSGSWLPGGCRSPEIQGIMAGPEERAPGSASTSASATRYELPDAAAGLDGSASREPVSAPVRPPDQRRAAVHHPRRRR